MRFMISSMNLVANGAGLWELRNHPPRLRGRPLWGSLMFG